MRLTKEEQEMLAGKQGYPVQASMEHLVALGEAFDAEKMVPVASVHLTPAFLAMYKAAAIWCKELADKGGKFRVFASVNPRVADARTYNDPEVGISEETRKEDDELNESLSKMGAFLSYTCVPYTLGNVPRFGQHVAWNETSAVFYANGVLGARTNREGTISDICSALTGLTPAFGYHLAKNRHGHFEIKVTTPLNGFVEYGVLGEFMGRLAGDQTPVLTGINPSVSRDELITLAAEANTSGNVNHCHIVGITPEAPTLQAAFGSKKKWEVLEFGKKEYQESMKLLDRATDPTVDIVHLGCPHYSIEQMRDAARLLEGKKLNTELWLMTSQIVLKYAENMGYADTIEASGARIITDTCPMYIAREELKMKRHGPRRMATDSSRVSLYMSAIQATPLHYGTPEKCIEAAITGKWR